MKQDIGQSMQLAFTFIPYKHGYSSAIRQFGLNLLEHVVKTLGLQVDLVDQGLLERLWTLAFGPDGLNWESDESRAIKEKMAVVIVEAAVRVWPQRWNNLFDLLLHEVSPLNAGITLSTKHAINAEVALTIIRILIDQIHNPECSWDDERKNDLQYALSAVLPGFAGWLWTVFPLTAACASENDGNSMNVLTAEIKAFALTCHWVNLDPVKTPHVIGTLFNIAFNISSLRDEVLESLLIFSTRSPRTNDDALFVVLIDQEIDHIEQLLSLLIAAQPEDDLEERYAGLKKITETLVNLSISYVCHRKNPALSRCLGRLLNVLLGLMGIQSLILSSLSILFWVAALRSSEKLLTHPDMVAIYPSLFMKLLTGLAADRRTNKRSSWNRLDFDTDSEFNELWAATTNRQQGLFDHLASKHDPTVEYLRSAVGSFVVESQIGQNPIPSSTHLLQWSALCTATEAVARGYSKNASPRILETMSSLLEGYLGSINPATSHPEVLSAWILAVKGVSLLLGKHISPAIADTLIPGTFNLIVSYEVPTASIPSLSSPGEKTTLETSVKGRAYGLLLKLAPVAPNIFIPHLEALQSAMKSSTPTGAGGILRQRFFTELFLVIAPEIEDVGRRFDLVDLSVRSLLEQLEGANQWIADPITLRQAIGAHPQMFLMDQRAKEAAAEFRKNVCNLLALIFIVTFNVGIEGIEDYNRGTIVPRMLSFLVGFLGCLQKLSSPEFWSSTPEEQVVWHDLFVRRQNDATNVHTAFDPATLDTGNDVSGIQTVRGWMNAVQVSALVSTGLCSKLPGFYSSYSLTPLCNYLAGFDPTTASIWSITWNTKHLLHHLLVNCNDPSTLEAPLPAHLNRILGATSSRLTSEWIALEECKNSENFRGSADLAAEIERESELIAASQLLINLLYDTLYPLGERDKKVEPCLDMNNRASPELPFQSKLAIWMITGDLTRQEVILRVLIDSLSWRHTVGFSKILLLALRWTPTLMMNQALHASIFSSDKSLLSATFRIIVRPELSDFHSSSTQLACELYKWSIFFGYHEQIEVMLSSLPGSSPQALNIWRVALFELKTSKQHREAARVFFRPIQASAARETAGKAFVVPKLPEKLILLKKLKEPDPADEVTAEQIENLFA